MNGSAHISTIVYRQMGFIIQGDIDVLIIGYLILPLYGISGNTVLHQSGGRIVLGAEGIGGTEDSIGPSCL